MRTGMVLLCLGLAACSWLPALPPGPLWLARLLCAVCVLALTVVFLWQPAGPARAWLSGRSALCLLLCFCSGLSWSVQFGKQLEARRLPVALEGQDIWVEGVVEGLIRPRARNNQIQLKISAVCLRLQPAACSSQPAPQQAQQMVGGRIVLNDYNHLPIQSGERWWLRVRLHRVHGLANPGAYDFEAAQAQQGIIARGYIRDTTLNHRQAPARWQLDAVRAAALTRLQAVPGLQHVGIINALVVGDRTGISAAQWDLLSATGTNHLLVISGLHVSFVALIAYWLVNLASRLSIRLLQRFPAQQLGAIGAVVAALIYSGLAGFSLPTQRALVMVCIAMLPLLVARRSSPSHSFLLAMTLVLVRDPLAATQAGFWLSFTAVGALLLACTGQLPGGRRMNWRQRVLQGWVKPQWVVSLGLLVPLLFWTGQVSLLSPVANMLAIPLVSFWVVPLALGGALLLLIWPAGGAGLLSLADLGIGWLWSALAALAAHLQPLWQSPVPGFTAGLLAAAGCLLLLLPRGLLPRWPGLCLLLPLLWPPPAPRPGAGVVWLQMLDVGQGLAVLVRTASHTLIFDTGPRTGPDSDAGRSVLLPVLRQQRVQHLHTVLISHWHEDHYGGLQSVLQHFPVTQLLLGGGAVDAAQQLPSPLPALAACAAGMQWQLDGVEFLVLHPDAGRYRNLNDQSCVLLIVAGDQRVLLTGDIELAAERALVRRYGAQLRADILQAPHHGSRTSSSALLLEQVRPAWLLVSAGYRNRFGHPSAEVITRAAEAGIAVRRTDYSGALWFVVGEPGGPRLEAEYRQLRRRFWRNIPPDEYGKVAAISAGG